MLCTGCTGSTLTSTATSADTCTDNRLQLPLKCNLALKVSQCAETETTPPPYIGSGCSRESFGSVPRNRPHAKLSTLQQMTAAAVAREKARLYAEFKRHGAEGSNEFMDDLAPEEFLELEQLRSK